MIPVSPLALTIMLPSFVPQFETSFWNIWPSIGKKAVLIDWVTISPTLSLILKTKERVGVNEALNIGWNKSSVDYNLSHLQTSCKVGYLYL